jgi:type II secretory pathway component GspD/PulD (secretin)
MKAAHRAIERQSRRAAVLAAALRCSDTASLRVRFRISDFGFRIAAPNSQSAIPGTHWVPQLRRHVVVIVLLTLFTAQGRDVAAQTSQVHDAFEEAEAALPEEINIEQPPSMRPQGTAPAAAPEIPPDDAVLPPPAVEGKLPLAGTRPGDGIQISQNAQGLITLVVRDRSLSEVLALLAETQDLNIVAANSIDALITITLNDVPLEQALTAILSVANYTWVERNGIILITSLTDTALPADVQGRQIEVFDLDFASATVVAEAVNNLVTAGVGKVTISETSPDDNRRTREFLVVEDLPDALARIAAYIHQVDQPPRQVLIEAHVLQVNLTDETRCGVDLHALCRIAGSDAHIFSIPSVSTGTGLPNSGGLSVPSPLEPPAFVATFAGNDLQAVIEALQTTTDSKTLGSPKILVLNGQQAHIQVGETIYYSQTTTTETSSQQGAASVETGVILRITPRITQDDRVLLRVEPQVSNATGERPSVDLPPNIARIELQSDVMLRDGEGMIIGGLIDERDVTNQQKLPYLGDVKGIGWLFRHSTVTKERTEILFALVPRIQPYNPEYQAFEQGELVRAGVPLMEGPLCRTHRPWDPVLPDGKRVYRPLIPQRHRHFDRGYQYGSEYIVPPHPLPVQQFYGADCDPEWQGAGLPSSRPLLSDDAVAMPPGHHTAPQAAEVISDQD